MSAEIDKKMIRLLFLLIHQARVVCSKHLSTLSVKILLKSYGVKVGNGLLAFGLPYVYISKNGVCKIGNRCMLTSSRLSSISGAKMKTRLEVRHGATLTLGDDVGMSGCTLFCTDSITIGNHVKIGFGTHIYDTDFHSLDATLRASSEDGKMAKRKPVCIGDNVFIGTRCIILKGVMIGDNSVIAAGSVVVKSVPANELWGGNPAKFIRKV